MKTNPEFFLVDFEDNYLIDAVILRCDILKNWTNH